MILISGPTIAALRLRTRMAKNLAMRRGEYGPSFMIDGVRYVRLDEVERRTALKFSNQQLSAAAGLPGRLLVFEGAHDGAAAA
jgi:hypothetical protein